MLCPKCGRELGEGNMYCEHCGEEIRIVPDFIPEIETSIEENLSNLAIELSEEANEDKASEEIKGKKKSNNKHIDENADEDEIAYEGKSKKSLSVIYILSLIILFLALLCGLAIMIYHDNSASYQVKMGDMKYDEQHYKQAIGYYEKAIELEPDLIEYRMRLADCYVAMENIDMAVEVYKNMILYNPSSKMAYAQIIALYERLASYDEIEDFLSHNANDDIRAEFIDYLAEAPVFSYEEGSYEEEIKLTLTNESAGKIFYAVDDGLPDQSSFVYTDPIFIGRGSHTVSAFFENEYGVCSSVVTKKYEILPDAPDAPIVSLESGSYDLPQLIKLVVPTGCSAYYTVDGSEPDRFSRIYGEPIPLAKGESHYKFVTINNQGISSEVISRDYSFDLATSFDENQGLILLLNHLTDKQYIVDSSGASDLYPGIFSYLYADLRYINGISMYCYNEYYVYGTGARAMTSNIFGVDVNTGLVYLVKHGTNDTYTCQEF